jgi:MoaA/NifB/PqqE/SkfB family radical SAM enzyme
MDSSVPDDIIAWEDIIYIADLLLASSSRGISLLGGEPTLHPDFGDIVLYLVARGFHVHVFTSGIMSDATFAILQRKLGALPRERLAFICNANDPRHSPENELTSVHRFLAAFAAQTTLGFNIYRPDFDLHFLFDTINRFGLERRIRLGLAHPIPGEANQHLAINDMPRMAQRLLDHVPDLAAMKIDIGFDCGFPYCLFDEQQVGRLFPVMRGRLSFGCGPAIDISPDMSVWSCFPLSNLSRRSLFEFDSLADITAYYEGIGKKVRVEAGGLFEACDDCRYREQGLCSGGCLAHILGGFRGEAKVRPEFLPA